MKKIFKVLLAFIVVFTFCGCSSKPKDDAVFLENLEKGLSDCWLYVESTLDNADMYEVKEYKGKLNEVVQKELTQLGEFSEYTFSDDTLKDLAKKYYEALNLTKEGVQYYDPDDLFMEEGKFADSYFLGTYQRYIILDTLTKNYDFMKDSPKKAKLEETLSDIDEAKSFIAKHDYKNYLKDNLKFTYDKEQSDEYSSYYTAIIENITEVEFDSISITADILDKDGIIIEQSYAGTSNFKPGAKAKLEIWLDAEEPFGSIEVSNIDIYVE